MAVHVGEVLIAPVENEPGPLAFGHTPNYAAKLQQAARPGSLVVSEDVYRLVHDAFELHEFWASDPRGSVTRAYEVLHEHRVGRPVQRSSRTPFVGRSHELDLLAKQWSTVRDGDGVATVVTGDRGIGKTRLTSEFVEERAVDSMVLACACSQLESGTPYHTFRALVADGAGIAPDDPPPVAAALFRRHLVDELGLEPEAAELSAAALGYSNPSAAMPAVDPMRLTALTHEALVAWLARLSKRTPTVLFVDDIADADPSSLAVLADVIARPPPHLLVLCTCASSTALPPSLTGPQVQTVTLEPFDSDTAERLVDEVARDSTLARDQRDTIIARSEGVPLFLEELATAAVDADDPHAPLPVSLTGRLQARLTAQEIDREIVAVLAVAGHEVPADVLTSVLGVDAVEMHDRLRSMIATDLVLSSGTGYRFRHGLLAEAAESLGLESDNSRLHGRLADVMALRDPTGVNVDWSLVGHHLRLAGRPLDAFSAILRGAERARLAGGTDEALRGYADALAIVSDFPDATARDVLELRARLLRGVAAVAARGFGAEEAIEDFGRCAELCQRLGPRAEYLPATTGVFSYYLLQGDLAAARSVAEDLRSWIDAAHGDYRPENELSFGVLAFFEGKYEEAAERLRWAADRFRLLPQESTNEHIWLMPLDPGVAALSHLAAVLWVTGHPRDAQAAGDDAIARAGMLDFPEGPFSLAYASSYLSWMYAVGGHHDTAAQFATRARDLGRQYGFAFWETTGEIHLALAEHFTTGRPDAFETVMGNAAIWEFLRARVFLPYVLTAVTQTQTSAQARPDRLARLNDAAGLAQQTGSSFYEAERLRLKAGLYSNSPETARALLTESCELAHRQGAQLFELRAALELARLDPTPQDLERLESVASRFPRGVGYQELNQARVLLSQQPDGR